MNFLWYWLIHGLVAYITGMITDSLLYQRRMRREGADIAIIILSLVLGPITWLLVCSSIYYGIKRRKK